MNDVDVFGVLYLIGKGGGFSSRTRLQKLVLIGREDKSFDYPFSFNYASYYYGPYSEELASLIDSLVYLGFLKEDIKQKADNPLHAIYSYALTEKGGRRLRAYKVGERNKLQEKIDKLWTTFKDFSNERIIKYAKEISGIESLEL